MSRLFRKVLLAEIVLFGIIAVAVSAVSAWLLYDHLTREFRSKGAAIASSISYSAVDTLVSGELSGIQAILEQFQQIEGVSYVLVTDPAGEILAHTFVPAVPESIVRICREANGVRRRGTAETGAVVREFGDVIDVSAPILTGLAGTVHVGMDRRIITGAIWSAILKQQAVVFALFLASIVAAFLFVQRISRPLTSLARHAQGLARADFAPEALELGGPHAAVTGASDEVGDLARSFSQMERTLKEHMQRLREAAAELERYSQSLELRVEERTRELVDKNAQLERALEQLKTAQDQIVMQEKLASLGALTAGVAHEIKNPLNFINNFSKLSRRLVGEIREEIERRGGTLAGADMQALEEILQDLETNLTKIAEHGSRADAIVQNMLLHSRAGADYRTPTDVNRLVEEYVNLAYHGMRARDPGVNVTIEREYDRILPAVEMAPQDIGRVLVNLMDNACYAAHQKKQASGPAFSPVVAIRTANLGERVEIRVRDNGAGIPAEIRKSIFNPFFTTKPPGQGTGLGLSIAFDIIAAHQGQLRCESEPGQYTEFIISMPVKGHSGIAAGAALTSKEKG